MHGCVACSNGGWVSAEQVKEEPRDEEMRLPPPPAIKQEEKPESLVREKTVGTGMFLLTCFVGP